jgi:hypothetical protein
MSKLHEHAVRELNLQGLLDNDSDFMYGDMLGKAVLELIDKFAAQGHSGMSGSITLQLFSKLADFKSINPITNDPDEWHEVGKGQWQNIRQSSSFSNDGGKTYYDLDDKRWLYEKLPFSLRRRMPQRFRYHMKTSEEAK